MLDRFRTVLAHFISSHFTQPRQLVIWAWFWLAAQTDDLQGKRHCLNAILEPDPENEPASLALVLFDQRRPTSWGTVLGTLSTCLVCATLPNRPCCRSASAHGV
jgi:hypothetical protein